MKRYTVVGIIGAAGLALTGCLTSVKSQWEKDPDGVIRARVSVLSSGTQSEALAKGFDAGPEGSILEDASGKQDSTSAVEAFRDIAVAFAPMLNALAAGRTPSATPLAAAPYAPAATATASGYDPPVTVAPATVTGAPEATKTVAGTNGLITVAILGDRSSCPLCRSLWSKLDAQALSSALCGAKVVDADRSSDSQAFDSYRPAGGFSYPLIRVFESGDFKGEFVARGMTQDAVAARIRELAPACRQQP